MEIIEKKEVQVVDEKTIEDYIFGSQTRLTAEQKKMFVGMAKSFNLNPFKREIYAIPYEKNFKTENGTRAKKTEMNIVTGYQTYIDRACTSGMLDGRKVELVKRDDGKTEKAVITIRRKDWREPFVWEVSPKEFIKTDKDGQLMGSRKTMPEFMLKKVAIGQGFRLAFPNELGGMPYLQEEITAERERQAAVIDQDKEIDEVVFGK